MTLLKAIAVGLAGAMVIVLPGGLLLAAAVVGWRRYRERNRVTVIYVGTRELTLQAFVPRISAVVYRA